MIEKRKGRGSVQYKGVVFALFFSMLFCGACNRNDSDDTALNLALLNALSSSSDSCSSSAFCKMFVTASNATTNAGIAGLDANCSSDSQKPSGGGTYKAMVSDGTNRRACTTANCSGGTSEHIGWVLKPSKQYRRADGTTVIGTTTASGVFSFPLSNAIQTTITGTNSTATGLNTDWTSSGNDCSDWSGSNNASNGLHDDTSSNLLSVGSSGCGNVMKVICVEQ